jgi:flagellar protein FliO/FliZ
MSQPMISLLWFVGIVALIPLALWLMKRSPLMGQMGGKPGTPRLVASLAVSTQQKLVTVEVGQGDARQWLVLGVSPQGIRTLHTMAAQEDQDGVDAGQTLPGTPAPAAFAQLLGRLRSGKAKGHDRDDF